MDSWVGPKFVECTKIAKKIQICEQKRCLTNYGENVQILEDFFAKKFYLSEANKVAIVAANASCAIQAVVSGFKTFFKKDLKFATQAFTFPSSAQGCLRNVSIIDIGADGGLDLDKIDADKVDGIIVTNCFGHVCELENVQKWGEFHEKLVIFDNAATPFSFYNNKLCHHFGVASVVSLHHTKSVGYGEGGLIIVDKQFENVIRSMCNFGFNQRKKQFWNSDAGNFKMSEISAIYIAEFLENNFDIIVEHNRKLYLYFHEKVAKMKGITSFPNACHSTTPVVSCLAILFETNYARNMVKEILSKHNIEVKTYYKPLTNQWSEKSKSFYSRIMCLPCHVDVSCKHVDDVLGIISANV